MSKANENIEDIFDKLRTTGPTSSMPNSHHSFPPGAKCDRHPQYTAYYLIQGETDSFGSERHFMCAICYTQHEKEIKRERNKEKRCDWCGQMKIGLRPRRDYEEGMGGRLYDVCGDCIKAENDRAREYLDEADDW